MTMADHRLTITLQTADDCTATWQVWAGAHGALERTEPTWDAEAFLETAEVSMRTACAELTLQGDEWRAVECFAFVEPLERALLECVDERHIDLLDARIDATLQHAFDAEARTLLPGARRLEREAELRWLGTGAA